MNATWTPDRQRILREMWARGCSASHIARELGGLGRGAVLGFIRRNKVTRDAPISYESDQFGSRSIWELDDDERRDAFRRVAAHGARRALEAAGL